MARRIKTKTLKIKNCKQCPFSETRRTRGSGYAIDYVCRHGAMDLDIYHPMALVIAGYVENSSEEPKDGEFPEWCPL